MWRNWITVLMEGRPACGVGKVVKSYNTTQAAATHWCHLNVAFTFLSLRIRYSFKSAAAATIPLAEHYCEWYSPPPPPPWTPTLVLSDAIWHDPPYCVIREFGRVAQLLYLIIRYLSFLLLVLLLDSSSLWQKKNSPSIRTEDYRVVGNDDDPSPHRKLV